MSFINGKNKFDYCIECQKLLRPSHRKRTSYKTCYECRGIQMPNYELSKVCKEILNTPTEPSEDELFFEDCPKAVNELEYGKVIKQSRGYVYSESAMAEIIVDTKK